jgi:hypothetical protein
MPSEMLASLDLNWYYAEGSARLMPIDDLRAHWARRTVPYFLPPTLVLASEDGQPGDQRTSFSAFLHRVSAASSPERFLILGGAGSGKSSFLFELGFRTIDSGELVTWLDAPLLRRLPDSSDPIDLLRANRPNEIDEALWRARLRRGRILILIDAVDELEFRYKNTRQWKAILRLLKGPHQFTVVATSRSVPDDILEEEDAWDDLNIAHILSLTRDEASNYLTSRGLQPNRALSQIRGANLDTLAVRPLFLSIIADHLLNTGGALPHSRAGLLLAACVSAGKRSAPLVPRRLREIGLGVDAAFTAAMLLIFTKTLPEISSLDLARTLQLVWQDEQFDDIRRVVDALSVHHLVVTNTNAQTVSIRPLHDCFVEFALASIWRHSEPPAWALLRPDLEHVLGDWVGLQSNPSNAALRGAELSFQNQRPEQVIDVLVANHGVIDYRTKVDLWRQVGRGLVPKAPSELRHDLSRSLSRVPHAILDEAVYCGIFHELGRIDQTAANRLVMYVPDKGFSARYLQRVIAKIQGRPHYRPEPLPMVEPARSADVDEPDQSVDIGDATAGVGEDISNEEERLIDDLHFFDSMSEQNIIDLLSDFHTARATRKALAFRFSQLVTDNSLKKLLDQTLAFRNRDLGWEVVRDLLSTKDPRLVGAFSRILVDTSVPGTIRRWIVRAIDESNAAEFEQELATAARDENLRMLGPCLRLLGSLRTAESVKPLINILYASPVESAPQFFAVRALGESATPEAMAALQAIIEDGSVCQTVRSEALRSYSSVAPPDNTAEWHSSDICAMVRDLRSYQDAGWLDLTERECRRTLLLGDNEPIVSSFSAHLTHELNDIYNTSLDEVKRREIIVSLALRKQIDLGPQFTQAAFDSRLPISVKTASTWALGHY